MRLLKNHWLWFGASVLLVALFAGLLLLTTNSRQETAQTKQDISDGKCSTQTLNNLTSVLDQAKSSGDKAAEGAALEKVGLCYIYRDDKQQARDWFTQAKDAFETANLPDDAARVQNSITAIEAASRAAPEGAPQSDEVNTGNEQ